MLATTSADGSAAVWDLALERDPEEEAAAAAAMSTAAPDDLPPQLLFVHGGQGDLKEAHWHPQARPARCLSGLAVSPRHAVEHSMRDPGASAALVACAVSSCRELLPRMCHMPLAHSATV
jgi:hypothetical protein